MARRSAASAQSTVTYKLRDWLFSRQRYWGEPFPVLHLEDGTHEARARVRAAGAAARARRLPADGRVETPLARATRLGRDDATPRPGEPARRDTNTMPQWAGSCWYYLRFCDPRNDRAAWSPEAERYWMPVDLYVGGAEHAVLHLLYARFWHKVLYDLGLVHTKEPFQKLLNQGMILGYSYRYYDDNLERRPERTAARRYPAPRCASRASARSRVATGREREGALVVPDEQVRWRRRRRRSTRRSPTSRSRR